MWDPHFKCHGFTSLRLKIRRSCKYFQLQEWSKRCLQQLWMQATWVVVDNIKGSCLYIPTVADLIKFFFYSSSFTVTLLLIFISLSAHRGDCLGLYIFCSLYAISWISTITNNYTQDINLKNCSHHFVLHADGKCNYEERNIYSLHQIPVPFGRVSGRACEGARVPATSSGRQLRGQELWTLSTDTLDGVNLRQYYDFLH